MFRRARVLPLVAAVAALALGARLLDVWHGFAVMAQDQPPTASAAPAAEPGRTWNAAPAAGSEGEAEGEEAAASDAPPAPDEATAEAQDSLEAQRDPLNMTDAEVELLQALAERREEIERRARVVDEREALLQAAERRIEEKVVELKTLQGRIEALLKQHEAQTEEQYRSLVKIYSNMKPKDAARIFEELDMDVLLPVVERMKERKTAPILAKMNPDKAKSITTELAQRRLLNEKK